jgi:hypothetical protein
MEMRIISTRMHGVLDYIMGATLAAAPAFLDKIKDEKAARYLPIVLGSSTIAMSLLTDYELSVSRQIPMRVHLNVDMMNGLLLALSPWIFGFSKKMFIPHLAAGIMEFMAGLMTKRTSENQRAELKKIVNEKYLVKKLKKTREAVKAVH